MPSHTHGNHDSDNPFILSTSASRSLPHAASRPHDISFTDSTSPGISSQQGHAQEHAHEIQKLDTRSSRLISSTLRLPSLGAILDCLLWNSLQGGASKVDVWVDVSDGAGSGDAGDVKLEVRDDGRGIGRWGLDEVGEWEAEEGHEEVEEDESEGEGGGGLDADGSPVRHNGKDTRQRGSAHGSSQISLLEIITTSSSAAVSTPSVATSPVNAFSPLRATGIHTKPRVATSDSIRSTPCPVTTPYTGGQSLVYQKLLKGGKTLYCGPSKRASGMQHGTTVMVRDVFYNVPVRQRTNLSSHQAAMNQCKRALESIALGHPGVQWNLYERRATVLQGREGVKHITGSSAATKSIDVFRNLFGRSGVERVQNIRVSSGSRRIDGFISLEGSINKSHQHLYINSCPVAQGELHALISKRFARSRFSAYVEDGMDDAVYSGARKSPRRLERYPIYVLNLSLQPADDTDLSDLLPERSPLARISSRIGPAVTPTNSRGVPMPGGQAFDRIKAFVSAVIDEFLQRYGFTSKMPLIPDHSDPVARAVSAPIRHSPARLGLPHSPDRVTGANPGGTAMRRSTKDASSAPCESDSHSRPASAPLHHETPLVPAHQQDEEATDRHLQKRRRISTTTDIATASTSASAIDIPTSKQGSSETLVLPGRQSYQTPQRRETPVLDNAFDTSFSVDASGRKRYKWIDDIIGTVDTGLLPFASSRHYLDEDGADHDSHDPERDCYSCSNEDERVQVRRCHSTTKKRNQPERFFQALPSLSPARGRLTDQSMLKPTDVSFTPGAIAKARVIRQVDSKFIACVMTGTRTACQGHAQQELDALVLVDQHAADERVSVEPIFAELCAGFIDDTIQTSSLTDTGIVLSREEGEMLRSPGIAELVARWGIHLEPLPSHAEVKGGSDSTGKDGGLGDYVQIGIQAVPSILKARLGRKDGKEMTRLLKVYLPFLVENIGQIQALLARTADAAASSSTQGGTARYDGKADWTAVHRYMPLEMVELVNSKACRNAIMFGDRLMLDQCQRLIAQLGQTRYPFICAHGRPTTVPLFVLSDLEQDTCGGAKRSIDWDQWRKSW